MKKLVGLILVLLFLFGALAQVSSAGTYEDLLQALIDAANEIGEMDDYGDHEDGNSIEYSPKLPVYKLPVYEIKPYELKLK